MTLQNCESAQKDELADKSYSLTVFIFIRKGLKNMFH